MSSEAEEIGQRLNEMLSTAGLEGLEASLAVRFGEFYCLLRRWNARTNLTAVRDEEGILSRHFVESIVCARKLPAGIRTLLDFGSGAGFPGIPIALCRQDIAVTLAESQGKKAAFLREAVRTLGLGTTVHSWRAETLASRFDCVTLRAVDRMGLAVEAGVRLVSPGGWLVVMTTEAELESLSAMRGTGLSWSELGRLPGSRAGLVAGAQVGKLD